jgi:DNA/RNA-binding domain of Phe-tRNA-synthetase-like protein
MKEEIFRIDTRILSRYPEIKIGVLMGRNVRVYQNNPLLEEYKVSVIQNTIEELGSKPLTEHLFIRSWREMYRSFGTKPGDYRPSAEALLRRVLKSNELPMINTAVDTYNLISIRHRIPIGGFDQNQVIGKIKLRFSEGMEPFSPLGASNMEETYPEEVVYADDSRILTRRWNYRDCDETKITENTSRFVMFLDGSEQIPIGVVKLALRELLSSLKQYCGGQYSTYIAEKEKPSISI